MIEFESMLVPSRSIPSAASCFLTGAGVCSFGPGSCVPGRPDGSGRVHRDRLPCVRWIRHHRNLVDGHRAEPPPQTKPRLSRARAGYYEQHTGAGRVCGSEYCTRAKWAPAWATATAHRQPATPACDKSQSPRSAGPSRARNTVHGGYASGVADA